MQLHVQSWADDLTYGLVRPFIAGLLSSSTQHLEHLYTGGKGRGNCVPLAHCSIPCKSHRSCNTVGAQLMAPR